MPPLIIVKQHPCILNEALLFVTAPDRRERGLWMSSGHPFRADRSEAKIREALST